MHTRALFHALSAYSLAARTDAAVLGRDIPPRSVAPREILGLNVWKLYDAVKDALQTANAYDPSTPDKCNLYVRTSNGGNVCEQPDIPSPNHFRGCDLNPRDVMYPVELMLTCARRISARRLSTASRMTDGARTWGPGMPAISTASSSSTTTCSGTFPSRSRRPVALIAIKTGSFVHFCLALLLA